LPLSALCIEPKKAAWVLYVDLVCINYDGNAFDASVLAIMAALRDSKQVTAPYVDLIGSWT
jgi:exosome complex component RRP43